MDPNLWEETCWDCVSGFDYKGETCWVSTYKSISPHSSQHINFIEFSNPSSVLYFVFLHSQTCFCLHYSGQTYYIPKSASISTTAVVFITVLVTFIQLSWRIISKPKLYTSCLQNAPKVRFIGCWILKVDHYFPSALSSSSRRVDLFQGKCIVTPQPILLISSHFLFLFFVCVFWARSIPLFFFHTLGTTHWIPNQICSWLAGLVIKIPIWVHNIWNNLGLL